MTARALSAVFALLTLAAPAQPAPLPKPEPAFTTTEDVVYGRRVGLALILDVLTPKNPNGLGVFVFVSAEFRSGRDLLALFRPAMTPFLDRGYTVFAVMHGSQPTFTVPQIVEDAHRAVRFIRHNAKKYGIDPEKLGAAGGSAGRHLALMVGCAGGPGNPGAKDPVDRESSKVAAVACFFPPTDFLALENAPNKDVAAAFDFREFDPKSGTCERVTGERRRQIGREISPITHATKDSAPALIVHGDKDKLVPVEQSKAMVAKLKERGAACELKVKQGREHFGLWIISEVPTLVDWLDKHLLTKK